MAVRRRPGTKRPMTKEEARRRKRQKLNIALSKQCVKVLMYIYFVIALFLLVWPRTKVSEAEKRELTAFPKFTFASYFSGEFTSGINEWYTDTVPFRDFFTARANSIKSLFGIRAAGSVEVIGNVTKVEEVPVEESVEEEVTPTPTAEPTPVGGTEEKKDFREAEQEGTFENGFIIVKQDGHWRGLPLFGGGSGNDYAAFLNDLKAGLPSSVNVYSMPLPMASEYYLPVNYTDYSASQKDFFDKVADKMNEGIITVDVVNAIGAHKDEDIYLRTDHHWSQLGAYYAAQKFAEVAGVDFLPLSSYTEKSVDGYVGTLYAYTESTNLKNDPETFVWYEPNIKTAAVYYKPDFTYKFTGDMIIETNVPNSYLRFIGGDGNIVKIVSENKNGRKLAIVKDSYGNALVPCLAGSFEEIYVIDFRYFDRNLLNFISDLGITDVVVSSNADTTCFNTSPSFATLLTQDSGSSVSDGAPAVDLNAESTASE